MNGGCYGNIEKKNNCINSNDIYNLHGCILYHLSKEDVLIVYFSPGENSKVDIASSCSVTQINGENIGIIHALTNQINKYVKGDVFSIKTLEKYSGDINKVVKKAKQEQDKLTRPAISNKLENLDEYEIIFVGYPIWWGDMPQVMYSFFDEYDFSDKIIIPYSTSEF